MKTHLFVFVLLVSLCATNAQIQQTKALTDLLPDTIVPYVDGGVRIIIAGVILAILSALSAIIFCSGRFCCNCFGGRARSKGIICVKPDDWSPYSWKQIVVIKIAIVVVLLAIGACAVVGLVGNQQTTKGMNAVFSTAIDFIGEVVDRTKSIGQDLQSLPYTASAGEEVSKVSNTLGDYRNMIVDYKGQAIGYNKYRDIVTIIFFVLPIFLCLLGSIGAVFNLRWLSLSGGLFCFVCSVLIWLSFGIHAGLDQMDKGMCLYVDELLTTSSTNQTSTTTNSTSSGNITAGDVDFKSFLTCQGGGLFSGFSNQAQQAINTSRHTACDAVHKICNSSAYITCDSQNRNGTECSDASLASFKSSNITDVVIGCLVGGTTLTCDSDNYPSTCPQYLLRICNSTNVTVAECPFKCQNSTLRELTNSTLVNLDLLLRYSHIINVEILPLLECSFITKNVQRLRSDLCITFSGGIRKLGYASGVLGGFLLPATVLMILGFKRFRRVNRTMADLADLELTSQERVQLSLGPSFSPENSPQVSRQPAPYARS